jgi:hypothetical protein
MIFLGGIIGGRGTVTVQFLRDFCFSHPGEIVVENPPDHFSFFGNNVPPAFFGVDLIAVGYGRGEKFEIAHLHPKPFSEV